MKESRELPPNSVIKAIMVEAGFSDLAQSWSGGLEEMGHVIAAARESSPLPLPEIISRQQAQVLCFVLRRFVQSCQTQANRAAQDKKNIHYRPGDHNAFLKDAESASALLEIFAVLETPKPTGG